MRKVSGSSDIREPGKLNAWGQVPLCLPLDIPTRITGSKSGKPVCWGSFTVILHKRVQNIAWKVQKCWKCVTNCQVFQAQLFFPIVFTCHPACNIIPQKAMTLDKDAYDILHSERLAVLPSARHAVYSVAETSIVTGAERMPWMMGIDHLSGVMSENALDNSLLHHDYDICLWLTSRHPLSVSAR